MAEDMNNGNDAHRVYTHAITAQLGERVTNLGRRQSDLEGEMRSSFKQVESSVASLGNEMRTSIAALSTNIAERKQAAVAGHRRRAVVLHHRWRLGVLADQGRHQRPEILDRDHRGQDGDARRTRLAHAAER